MDNKAVIINSHLYILDLNHCILKDIFNTNLSYNLNFPNLFYNVPKTLSMFWLLGLVFDLVIYRNCGNQHKIIDASIFFHGIIVL